MRRPTAVLLVASAFTLALVATPAAGAQTAQDGDETVVGAEIGDGVSDESVESLVTTLEARLDDTGIDGHVETVTANDTQYVAVVTDADRDEVVPLLSDRGRVEIVARYPVRENGSTVYRETVLLNNSDFANVGPAQQANPQGGIDQPYVSVTIRQDGAARNYSQRLQEFGFTSEGIGSCPPDAEENPHDASGYCLYTVIDGEVQYAASMGADLARSMDEGQFAADPSLVMTVENMSVAERLSMGIRTGALPVQLTVTDLPESVEASALTAAENGSEDESGSETGADETREPTEETPASSTLGPGFTLIAAIVAIVLGSAALAARIR